MIAAETSMRYGMQMIAVSSVLRECRKNQMVAKDGDQCSLQDVLRHKKKRDLSNKEFGQVPDVN
ncbi:hypothetical protein KIN20_025526 [Parelaphostrongylus tenuis]|uniref:Uncharacterized protein n=1 Tax=Parelaphostrongylus tenuis TaxID=148309 RepID=A0AAD5MYJ6_PARTN|nr:hypothetical protein KIN20_025526 [Parelaphostrongylus tenuis]